MRRFVCTLGLLVCLVCGAGRAGAQTPEAGTADWPALLARDARISFSPRSALLAGEVLKSTEAPKELRAAAWMALGASGALARWEDLIEAAKNGSEPERGAATLALGELGRGGESLLPELAQQSDPALAANALLALLRTRNPLLRPLVLKAAADAADPRSAVAAKLLAFADDPAHSEATPAAELLLGLRWRAAREFGLVDGQSWKVLLFRALGERENFRSDVILRAAARIDRPSVRDLLLSALLHGTGEGRLRAAVRGIPRELAQLVQNGLWKPADLAEWTLLFDALEEEHLEAYVPELFEAALLEPSLKARALLFYSRSGAQGLAEEIEAALQGASPADRVLLCRAMGESEDPTYLQRLTVLASAGDPGVRAAALVAELLLGSRSGETRLRAILGKADDPLRPALLLELAANVRSPLALVLLEPEFAGAKGEEQRVLALALAREGVREARAWCRKTLASEPPPAPQAAHEIVDALRARLSPEDTEILRGLFPREDTPENLALNVDLALGLCELSDSWMHPLLTAALWKGSFEVSLLSGALLAQALGMHALRGEAANPPASARSTDLRRVGFALGTWGGLPEVEALAQILRYNSGAPALQGALLGFLSLRTQ